MQKQIAVAVAAALLAGSALAADVTLYGRLDTGLAYNNIDDAKKAQTSTFEMTSGVSTGSRWGLKGSEEIADGYTVGFQLESGFSSDSGKLSNDRLFHRESRLYVNTPYGTLSAGRMGSLTSGCGTYDLFQASADAMDGGWTGAIGTNTWFSRARYNNMLTYVTPSANGFTGYAQYSLGTSDDTPNSRDKDRYAALGLNYGVGALDVVVVLDTVILQKNGSSPYIDGQDSKAISIGGSYDFDIAKLFIGAQYGKNENGFAGETLFNKNVATDRQVDGYNLHIGAAIPLPCGTLTATMKYGKAEQSSVNASGNKDELEMYGVSLSHIYPMSKTVYSYVGVGYDQLKDSNNSDDFKKTFTVAGGLVVKF